MYTNRLSELRGVVVAARVAVLAAVALIITFVFSSTAGLVALTAGLVLGLLLELRPNRRAFHPLRTAAAEAPAHSERHVLVVANTTLEGDDLAELIREAGAIDIVAPPLPSLAHLAVTDIDDEMVDAETRLDASLAWANDHGLRARGVVGQTDPISSIADELRRFGADEVVVVTRFGGDAAESGHELRRLRADLDIPVREIAI